VNNGVVIAADIQESNWIDNFEEEFKLYECFGFRSSIPTYYCPPAYMPYVKKIVEFLMNEEFVRIHIWNFSVDEVSSRFCAL